MTHADLDRLEAQTDEGAQELRTRSRSREVVLTGGGMWPEDELGDTMIINMGPQHPSTHGVLRIVVKVNGEQVVDLDPVAAHQAGDGKRHRDIAGREAAESERDG